MRELLRRAAWVTVAFIGIAAVVYPTIIALLGDVPWYARDLNCDGRVSVSEWFEAGIDYGWSSDPSSPGCRVVFRFKDGEPITVWCSASPPCRRAR